MSEKNNQETRKCEVCGEIKPVADFSKSYRNRCKPCVAEMRRNDRIVSQMMKKPKDSEYKTARFTPTGEVVDVRPIAGTLQCRTNIFKTKDGRELPQFTLQFMPEIDWEQRRYEIAKDIFVHRLTLPSERLSLTEEGDAEIAVGLADTLVDLLKRAKK